MLVKLAPQVPLPAAGWRRLASSAPVGLRLAALALLLPGLAAAQTTPGYRNWFLAEGSTQLSFEEQVLIANPGTVNAAVTLTFLGPSGQLIPPVQVQVNATSRKTVALRDLVTQYPALAGQPVSVKVDSDQDIVVERTLYWASDVGQQPVPRRGAHSATGTRRAARRWYLAEGATQSIFDTYVLVSNATSQDAHLDVRFSRSDALNQPLAPLALSWATTPLLTVPAGSRLTLGALKNGDLVIYGSSEQRLTGANGIGPSVSFSTVLSSDVDITVERAMYWRGAVNFQTGSLWEGGTGSVGVTDGATEWYLAEGYTGLGPGGVKFDTYLLLFNASDTSRTQAEVTFLRSRPTPIDPVPPPVVCTYTLQPAERRTIWVNRDIDRTTIPTACGPSDPLAPSREMDNVSFSVKVLSRPDPTESSPAAAQPLIVERAMYWGTLGPGGWVEGHATPGMTAEATRWAFAEGVMDVDTYDPTPGQLYSSYFLISNSGTTKLRVKATFYREDGVGIVREYDVDPQSRFTIAPTTIENVTDPLNLPANREDLKALSNQRFAVVLEAIDDPATAGVNEAVPFVAERAVYWGGDWFGGTSSPGVAWPTAAVAPPPPPAPTVTAITPNTGSQAASTPVVITGTEFAQGTTVTINGVAATNVVVVNASTITAVLPPGAAGGPANVVLVTRGETVTTSGLYVYAPPPPPTVAMVVPDQGRSLGAESVEVRGTNFVPLPGTAPIVSFGGEPAPIQAAPAPTASSLFVQTPPHPAGFVTVTMFVNGQVASLPGGFQYYPFSSTDNVLAFGDSITYGVYVIIDPVTMQPVFPPTDGGYPARLEGLLDASYAPRQDFLVANAGVPGECAAGPFCSGNQTWGASRLPTVSGGSTPDDLVVILEGTNDVGVFSTPEIVAALDTMVSYALGAGKKVALCTLVPKNNADAALAASISQAIRDLKNTKYGATPNVVLVDLHATFPLGYLGDDGVHPTAEGYAFIAQRVFEAMRASFETR